MLMLCLEWWMFEIGGFMAGVISEVELGAQSVAYELTVVAYMVRLLCVLALPFEFIS
ncbi:Multidrug and toxin extrusion protein 1 [Liparis tanakae]|uniref:Multidrug and toxin extrusion protein 1 n=1 Tax=Liparis tanakae TaxID=230148 RepID=A0A4Z2EDI8_9TELE|nr:Multidrug and toxin extrusion protein 1 [Liparis tanakae]